MGQNKLTLNIRYTKMYINNNHITTEDTIYIKLHDGTWVDQKFYESVLQRIKTVLPTLDSGKVYKIEKLCGKDFWSQLKITDRQNAGKCLVDMVSNNCLLLCFAGKDSANSRRYRLK